MSRQQTGFESQSSGRMAGLILIVLVLAACGAAGEGTTTSDNGTAATGGAAPAKGGTLLLASESDVCAAFDPQKAYCSVNWAFQRVMARTLLSNNGMAALDGGTELHPDLAAEMPEISEDELTWIFKIKPGIMYGPPLEGVEVTAPDFIRAMMREADPNASRGGYRPYYNVIEGFEEFSDGKADTISGMTAPDDSTLVIKLTEPLGDLGYRMAMAAAAPIPPNPDDPDAPLGIAEGHTKDFGRFQVATGPYMFEGSENLDFSVPADEQTPVSGYSPDRSISLVRNPSWDAATDELRPAYVDAIQMDIGATVEDIANKVDAGDIDAGFNADQTPEQLQRYQNDPTLEPRLHVTATDTTAYAVFNLAQPPFDDIYVRKAVNLVIDKEAWRRAGGGDILGEVATHIIPNGLTGQQNADYAPFGTPNNQGDLDAAKEMMKQSKYDTDGDGVCDDPVCEGILTVAYQAEPRPKQVAIIADGMKDLGLTLDTKFVGFYTMYDQCEDPNNHVAFCPTVAWGRDYPDAYTFAPPLFGKDFLEGTNLNLAGATPEQLKKWGYTVDSVPDADPKMDECAKLEGDPRVTCYAELDRYLMEEITPWVPLRFSNWVDIVSERLTNYQQDTWADMMSLDHVAVNG